MHRRPDRRRRPPSDLLRHAARPAEVLDRAGFDEVLVGWLEAASRGLLAASVLLIELPSAGAADRFAPLLRSSLRSIDVIGRYDQTEVAVILDADGPAVSACIGRVRDLARGAGIDVEVSVWTGPPRT